MILGLDQIGSLPFRRRERKGVELGGGVMNQVVQEPFQRARCPFQGELTEEAVTCQSHRIVRRDGIWEFGS